MKILLGNAYQKGAIKPREALYGGMETFWETNVKISLFQA